MKYPFLFLYFVFLIPAPLSAGEVDDGLLDGDGMKPVFIRMEKQIFRKAGDYEAFCQNKREVKRSILRKEVIAELHANSDESWQTIVALVRELEGTGEIQKTQRYWIVNGFACLASAEACRKLVAHESVSFVYGVRGVPLHQGPAPRTAPDRLKQLFESVIDSWKDDTADPVDMEAIEVPWNVQRIKADRAWVEENATGAGVVVAVCDSGLMITPSLTASLWKNEDEIFNGLDDDGNGYVDDIFGYDYRADNWYALGDSAGMPHGSMCAGIIAGRPLNQNKLATGIAPRSRLMILKAMGQLKAYEYALENGADVLSMSYMSSGRELGHYRGLYRLAHEHLSAGGVLAVGGAGNNAAGPRAQPLGNQISMPKDIPCVIAVSGVGENDTRMPFSSQGPCWWEDVRFYSDHSKENPLRKPDLCAFAAGYPVWGRPSLTEGKPWKVVTEEENGMGLIIGPVGNSFAGPHSAGVAALMLSVNPELQPWQVKQLMEETCVDLGDEGWDPQHGAGLIDALAAVRAAKKAGGTNTGG